MHLVKTSLLLFRAPEGRIFRLSGVFSFAIPLLVIAVFGNGAERVRVIRTEQNPRKTGSPNANHHHQQRY